MTTDDGPAEGPGGSADAGGADGAFGWAVGYLAGDSEVELTPRRAARRRAGEATRRVIELLAAVDADSDRLAVVAEHLESAAELLRGLPPAELVGFAEAATAPSFDAFMDRSPILGLANPIAPPLRLSFDADDQVIVATATFGSAYEGPPNCVHGGWIAAAFDEVLGAAQSLSGSGGMTAYLKVDYRAPTPLHEPLRFEGRLARTEGRKIFTAGRLHHGEVLTAEAEALFVAVDFSRFAELRDQGRSPDT